MEIIQVVSQIIFVIFIYVENYVVAFTDAGYISGSRRVYQDKLPKNCRENLSFISLSFYCRLTYSFEGSTGNATLIEIRNILNSPAFNSTKELFVRATVREFPETVGIFVFQWQ